MTDLRLGDAVEHLKTLPDASVDAVVTDPPYPEIDRPYGRMTEADWHAMMRAVVGECRRVLKPAGSAVFVLQPNSERVGRMRPWLWEFMAWTCREWNMVQDVWWNNPTAAPTVHCQRKYGLMRQSQKACVWLGPVDCFRDQDAVLLEPSAAAKKAAGCDDTRLRYSPSGLSLRPSRIAATCLERGGSTPFNLLRVQGSGAKGHSAGTPARLANWWVRYISPPGGVVLDPFIGSGTVGIEALKLGRAIVGIERDPGYFATARARIEAAELAHTEAVA